MSYDRALDIPLGELKDLIAIEQIKHEGARLREYPIDDDEAIPDLR